MDTPSAALSDCAGLDSTTSRQSGNGSRYVPQVTESAYIISALQVSPDRQTIAVGTIDGELRLYDAISKNLVQTLQVSGDDIQSLQWSPDGGRIAIISYFGRVSVWNVASGTLLFTTELPYNGLVQVSWSPDGSQLAVSVLNSGTVVMNSSSDNSTFYLQTRENYDDAWNQYCNIITSNLRGIQIWNANLSVAQISGLTQLPRIIPDEIALNSNVVSLAVVLSRFEIEEQNLQIETELRI